MKNVLKYMSEINELREEQNSRGMNYIRGRLDFYLIAFMIQNYYADMEKYKSLDKDGRKIVDYLMSDEFYRDNIGSNRFYPLDKYMMDFVNNENPRLSFHMGHVRIDRADPSLKVYSDSSDCYALLNECKVFLMNDEKTAQDYWYGLMEEQLENSPHCYLEKKGNFNIKKGEIIADVGGAEGFFCIQHLDKIKHAYIFEAENEWYDKLQKTYAPFKDKVTLIKGFVGDDCGNISLDDYFRNKEKPTFFKMDVEGAEGSVLRSMINILNDPNLPLRLAICTYHRQEDAPYIESLLGEKFKIHYSDSYYWHMPDPVPPFLRHGVMRATKIVK